MFSSKGWHPIKEPGELFLYCKLLSFYIIYIVFGGHYNIYNVVNSMTK